jgi:hypothetical protein
MIVALCSTVADVVGWGGVVLVVSVLSSPSYFLLSLSSVAKSNSSLSLCVWVHFGDLRRLKKTYEIFFFGP